MASERARRGTKPNPFEVQEIVQTSYFRGAAPEKETIGRIEVVDCGDASLQRNKQVWYKVRWLDRETREPTCRTEWLTCRTLVSIERP